MIITVDRDNNVVCDYMEEGINYEYKIVDSVPEDIHTHNYKYSMGKFIDLGSKTLTEIEEIQQNITDLELNDIEQGQMITELELMILGGIE